MLVQTEVDKSLAREAQLQQKIEELELFTFELDETVRDANRKRRAAHKHSKHFKKLAHRQLNTSKEMLKISNELSELNQDLKDEADSLIKGLTSQEKILERNRLDTSQSQLFTRDLKRKGSVGKQGGASQCESWVVLIVCELLIIGTPPMSIISRIYTLYETLTGVDHTEVLSVSFI